MQLTKIRITNFRSVHDSTDIDIGSATCLVGKNESGKTAVLQALYRLNPLVATHGDFDATEDYPRRRLAQYEDDLAAERCEPATVTRATFELSADDIQAVAAVYGPDCLNPDNLTVTLRKGYTNRLHLVGPAVNADAALAHLVGTAGLDLRSKRACASAGVSRRPSHCSSKLTRPIAFAPLSPESNPCTIGIWPM